MRSAAIVALLGLALLAACDKPQPAAEIRPVRTVTAVAGSDGEPVSLTGHIRAQKEESLAFRIDGRMIKRHVEVGQAVRPNDLIAELDPLPQRDALHQAQAKLAAGEATLHEITVALTDDSSIRTTGRVREAAPQADATTRSYRVKVGLDETPEAMRLGATVFGQARMLGSKGIELPATALTMVDNQPAVWVVDPKSLQVSLRNVELQRHASSSVVVSKGVEPGELIVTAGVHALRPGQKVRLLGAPS